MRGDLRVELPEGTMVGYAEVGDPAGPPVVYLHGSPSSRLEVGLPGIREAAEDLGCRVLAPDRPGMGLSTFRRYTVGSYPRLVRSFADALGLGQFAVIGVSGGGKYACACAWGLPDRVTRVALVSSTCSFELPGARATWNADDRRLYRLADWTPWLVRLFFAKVARDVRHDRDALFSSVERTVGTADREVLAAEGFREALDRDAGEAFRQGGRGAAHDLTLEARPWGVPFERIQVPIEVWHGGADRVVSPEQSRILVRALPLATDHFVPGEGHFSLVARHARAILQSVVGEAGEAAPRRLQRGGATIDPRVRGESHNAVVYEAAIGRAFEHVAVSARIKVDTVRAAT
jgi:pimeloyl-ACP methyl ester carboxylesterase